MSRAVVADAITEWWVGPTATALTGPDRTVMGAVSSSGEVLACEMNHDAGTTRRTVVGQTQPDDHNAPALWVTPGRRAVIIWSRHGADSLLHVRVSTAPAAVDAWGPEVTVPLSGPVSYAQIHHIAHASTSTSTVLWVFTRVTGLTWQLVRLTVDEATGAVSAEPAVTILTAAEQTYISTADAHATAGQQLRLAWGYNPAASADAIRYVEIDAVTGAVSSPADPSVSGNVISGEGLPLLHAAVAPLLPDMAEGWSRRLLYVRPGPVAPAVAVAEWRTSAPDEGEYSVVDLTGARRSHGMAGPRVGYGAEANYVGGMAFPDPCPDERVAVARYLDGTSTVELAIPASDGTWSAIIGHSTASRLIRPTFVRGRVDRVVASDVAYYSDTTYTDYYADVVALFDDPVDPLQVIEADRTVILCGELRTGRILAEVPVKDASWEQIHREPGSVDASVPLAGLDARTARDLVSYLEGPRCFLAAARGDVVLEGGPIWSWAFADDASQTLKVRAGGLASIFDRRRVMKIIAAGEDPRLTVVGWDGVDLGTIAARLVRLAMSHNGGSLPIELPADRTGNRQRWWPGWQLPDMGKELSELMAVINGPDIALRPRYNPQRTHLVWDLLTGTEQDPLLHQDGEDWTWDGTVARSRVAALSVDRDWSSMTSRAWVTGEGQDEATLMAVAQDLTLVRAGYPLLESASARSGEQEQSTLVDHARADIARNRRPWQTWSLTLKGDPSAHRVRPGDWGQVWVPRGHLLLSRLLPTARPHRTRVVRVTGDLGETVSLKLAPTMEVR